MRRDFVQVATFKHSTVQYSTVQYSTRGRSEAKSLTSLQLRVVSHTKERTYHHLPEKKKGKQRRTKEKKGVPDGGNTKQPVGETILRK